MYKYDIYKYLMYVPMIWYHIISAPHHIFVYFSNQPPGGLDEQNLTTDAIGFQMAPASAPVESQGTAGATGQRSHPALKT